MYRKGRRIKTKYVVEINLEGNTTYDKANKGQAVFNKRDLERFIRANLREGYTEDAVKKIAILSTENFEVQ